MANRGSLRRAYWTPLSPDECAARLLRYQPVENDWLVQISVHVCDENGVFRLEAGSPDQQRKFGSNRWPANVEITPAIGQGSTITLERRPNFGFHQLLRLSLAISLCALVARIALRVLDWQDRVSGDVRNVATLLLLVFPMVALFEIGFFLLGYVADEYAQFLRMVLNTKKR